MAGAGRPVLVSAARFPNWAEAAGEPVHEVLDFELYERRSGNRIYHKRDSLYQDYV